MQKRDQEINRQEEQSKQNANKANPESLASSSENQQKQSERPGKDQKKIPTGGENQKPETEGTQSGMGE